MNDTLETIQKDEKIKIKYNTPLIFFLGSDEILINILKGLNLVHLGNA